MVVPRFVEAALKDEPLTVYGDGRQTRCFTHVLDIVDALREMPQLPTCFGKVINLGTDEEISINELAQVTVEVINSRSEIRHVPYDEAYGEGFEDMQRRVPSLDRARKLLGYQPQRDLRTIIFDVAADFRAAKTMAG